MLGRIKNPDGTITWTWTSDSKVNCFRCGQTFRTGESARYCRSRGTIMCKACDDKYYNYLHARKYANKYGEHQHFNITIKYSK